MRIVVARCDTNPLQIITVLFLYKSDLHNSFAVLVHALRHHANASHFHAVATLFDSVPQPGVTLRILALPRLRRALQIHCQSNDSHAMPLQLAACQFDSSAVQTALCLCISSACHPMPVHCFAALCFALPLPLRSPLCQRVANRRFAYAQRFVTLPLLFLAQPCRCFAIHFDAVTARR